MKLTPFIASLMPTFTKDTLEVEFEELQKLINNINIPFLEGGVKNLGKYDFGTTFAEKMEEVLEGMSTDKPPQFFVAEDLLAREQNEKNLPVVTGEKHLSYVLFTSGSTGEPKGVMIEQLGMINHLFLMIQDFDLINS